MHSPPRLVVALLAATAVVSLAGCGSHPADPAAPAVAVVVGNRENVVPLGPSSLPAGLVSTLVAEGAELSVIVCDGRPALVARVDLAASGPNSLYESRAASAEDSRGAELITTARAVVPEADTLGAIALAARAVIDSSGARTIVVFDSGLSTVAPLAFQDGVLADSPHEIVTLLRAADELPDLQGIAVTWYGLGEVSPPQPPLSIAELARLVSIWRAILLAAGAATVNIVATPLVSGAPAAGLPKVTIVPLGAMPALPGPSPVLVVPLSPISVNFVPGEAVYLEPAKAEAVLAAVAEEIKREGYRHVRVVGTAALPGYRPLSQARAELVRQSIVADGVPASEITAVGVGESFAGFVPDIGPGGALEPVEAEQDRLVIVTATK